ncbi:sensor histidine kinase [Paenibacillus sp. CF384]|uniref:sensor histidine kinase n=1 Tax=Paenibacillus sp. CF384 TaxID=1884382 RepID=UPI000897FEAB|nr:histidine kinase [Paenibacillus sp. CF384]SDX37840.1 Histidine kinase-, DNA gyrase B-, and HSP90-like ATPase [Paenibacillus sp. CF384]
MIGKLSYRHKIAAIIFVFAFLPMIILGSLMIQKVWSAKVQEIINKNDIQLTSSVNGINSFLSSNMDKLMAINNNFYIFNYLDTKTDQNLVGVMNFSDYLQSVINAMKADNKAVNFQIYAIEDTNYDGDYLRSIQNLEKVRESLTSSLKDEILNYDDAQILWKYRTIKAQFSAEESRYLFGYKKIMSLGKPLAIIELQIPIEQITDFFAYEIPEGSSIVYEIDGKMQWVIGEEQEMIPEGKPAKGDYYIINKELKPGIGEISMFVPKSLVFQELKGYLITVFFIFIMLIGILFVTVEMVSYFLTKKLEALFRKMNTNVESLISSDSFVPFEETEDEFGKMGRIFYELTMRIKEYYRKVTDYELEKTVLETQLLQERFNPHFLYNTLSTFRWIYNDPKVHEVVDSMVKYYRIALNKGSSIITIEQETEMIREYLRLQMFAYGNEFDYDIHIEGDTGEQLVLKNLLQPIVENAFLHGISGRESGGLITIRVSTNDGNDTIRFEIADNGLGMGPEKIKRILDGTEESKYSGYGMKNVRNRMETYYGSGYGLEIESAPGQGTKVILTTPSNYKADRMDVKSISA